MQAGVRPYTLRRLPTFGAEVTFGIDLSRPGAVPPETVEWIKRDVTE